MSAFTCRLERTSRLDELQPVDDGADRHCRFFYPLAAAVENSLFATGNSLFFRKISLFLCVGNLEEKFPKSLGSRTV